MSSPLGAALSGVVDRTADEAPLGVYRMLGLLGHSTAIGAILAGVGYSCGRLFEPEPDPLGGGSSARSAMTALGGAANLLFLCVGLTGAMLLVNNNMVRAFAIASAVALVRFRVKLDAKSTNASLLFGVLAGIACGLREVSLGWILLGVYVALATLLGVVVRARAIRQRSLAAVSGGSTVAGTPATGAFAGPLTTLTSWVGPAVAPPGVSAARPRTAALLRHSRRKPILGASRLAPRGVRRSGRVATLMPRRAR